MNNTPNPTVDHSSSDDLSFEFDFAMCHIVFVETENKDVLDHYAAKKRNGVKKSDLPNKIVRREAKWFHCAGMKTE
jgi:hypothetical protein